jgi:cysteine-rich repeat protein
MKRASILVLALSGVAACSLVNGVDESPTSTSTGGSGGQAAHPSGGGGHASGGGGHATGGGGQGAMAGGGEGGGNTCGDGELSGSEQCDDGNQTASDGCTGCVTDLGYTCQGAPSQCTTVCGDGIVAGQEACDDGNQVAADGCTSCSIDSGYHCGYSPSVCCRGSLTPCQDGCFDTNTDPDHCGSCNGPCGDEICVMGSCGGTCAGGATLSSIAPSRTMVVCDDPNNVTCEQDFETLCPAGWQLCSYLQFNERNSGWTFPVSGSGQQVVVGEIYCRTAASDAGHFTVPDASNATTNLGQDVPFNCYFGSSRPSCTAGWGCNEQYASALCCAPTPTCGNGVIDGPEEQCDDANASEADDCLNSCTYRVPTTHGITGTNCG